jgi:hypothetical protein
MRYLKIYLIILLLPGACRQDDRTHLSYETEVDSLMIKNDWDRGYFKTSEFYISASLQPFDSVVCKNIPLRNPPIIIGDKSKYYPECNLSDLKPPFIIYKRANSDTLTVLYRGMKLFFKIDEHFM